MQIKNCKRKEENEMKKVISYILLFILIILIILVCLLTIMKSTILNEEYVISKLEEAKYYDRMNGEIIEQFKNYTIQSGLSDDVLENLFTTEKLKEDINQVIDSIYTGKELTIDTTEIIENLKNNIVEEVEAAGKTVDFEEEAMEEYLNAIANAYESQVSYSTNTINSVADTLAKVLNLFGTVQIAVYVATAIIAVIIIVVNIKQIIGLKYITIALMGTGIFMLAAKIMLQQSIDFNNIMIMNQAVSQVLQLVINNILTNITIVGIVLLVIGTIGNFVYNLLYNKYLAEEE